MSPQYHAGPFHLDVPFDAAGLRQAFDRAGFTPANIQALTRGVKGNGPIDRALLDRRTSASRDPFFTLARLFFLAETVVPDALPEAFAPVPMEQLFAAGFLRHEGEAVRSNVQIDLKHELLICSDIIRGSTAPDHVLGAAPSALSLAALTLQRSVDSVLDLGTGGGIQALLASRRAERVVATDICPRALNFAAMNARLNGIENIELRQGSFFEPAGEERFEQIVSNPPFVISPESRFVHRDGGLGGDGVSELLARGAAARLEEGGYAVMLLNWIHETDDDWAERPCAWTQGNGCDVRWIRFSDHDPLTYAANWLREEQDAPSRAAARLEEWVRYYEAAGIRRLALGAVVMRKRSGVRNWTRCEDIPLDISLTASGDQTERLFDAEDLLQALPDDAALLDQRLQVHPGHNIEQRLALQNGAWALQSMKLHITAGMDFCADVDLPTLQFLAALDGTRTVREAAAPIAEALGRSLEDVSPICLGMTKRLLRTGLLMRV